MEPLPEGHEDRVALRLLNQDPPGLPLDRVDAAVEGRPLRDWKDLHKLLGLHLNVQIVEDGLDG